LTKGFDTEDLTQMILRVLKHPSSNELLQNARQRAVAEFGSKSVASKYIQLYEEAWIQV
jgi:glycosyltransferase involved in cell wall biosynthesis